MSPKIKNPVLPDQSQSGEDAVNLKKGNSALSDFVKKNLPSEEETDRFEEYVKEEVREHEIDEGLEEIYQDEGGSKVNIKKIDIVRSRGWLYKIFFSLVGLSALLALAWGGYFFYLNSSRDQSSVVLAIDAEKEPLAGKEFYYTVAYKNFDKVELRDLSLQLTYPDNFIFLSAEPSAAKDNNAWTFPGLGTRRSGEIRIKGKLVGEAGSSAIILASLLYKPANISSEFKKETSFESKIIGTGLDIAFDNPTSLMLGEWTELKIKYKAREENYLPGFRLTLDLPENLELAKSAASTSSSSLPGVWQIADIGREEKTLPIKFRFKSKENDSQDLNFHFEYSEDGQKYYAFLNQILPFEVMKRDLNLTLIVNGSRADQGVDFGQTLNYSIVFANKGRTEMKDVVIMAVVESDFLDWTTLDDKNKGKLGSNTLSWGKGEIPALASLAPENEGTIDFSVKLKPAGTIDPAKNYQVKSYAQFSVGAIASTTETDDSKESSRSNIIINKLNSDLSLDEQLRYYNDDNIAVGSGPVPPKVGQTTSYKVYWTLTNNLNELSGVRLESVLPAWVKWDGRSRASVGNLTYDQAAGKVVWEIGRLPITAYRSEAEFSLSITPAASDKNKVMVILSGTAVSATDEVTKSPISKTAKAKTTRLEDDPVVSGDGRVVE